MTDVWVEKVEGGGDKWVDVDIEETKNKDLSNRAINPIHECSICHLALLKQLHINTS